MKRLALLLAVVACHASSPQIPGGGTASDVVLFRDAAVITRRIEATLGSGSRSLELELPADAREVTVEDVAGLATAALRVPIGSNGSDADDRDDTSGEAIRAAPPPTRHARLDVVAPSGRYVFAVSYVTAKLTWSASYTLATDHAHDRASLSGALAVANTTGLALPHANVTLVDAPIAVWRSRRRETLAASLVGEVASTSPYAKPHALGEVTLLPGETRVALPGISAPRPMKSVLVYDPIGTARDNPGAIPVRDANLGVVPAASSQVSESYEIARDPLATDGLPAGNAKLYDGGTLVGEARLFDESSRVAQIDTIPVGTAIGVTGHRERRDLDVEDDERGHRLTEEFVITVDNARDRPVEVLVREHMYRGETWLIAYESTNHPAKEGAQQIALRTEVPAKSKAEVTYVVVYSWKP